ncbi:hypothetical protein AQS70_15100 [Pseudomonas endophytica]|uniref:Uncharacterized protein n=1 Tax=Pseudomonas endophytica TaxID=1563157 RepID=A0A0Q0WXQ1_9PSED|nr:hypothetical protein [Pseudomonas endophytica]KQB52265.1 hypothetical protein AQS70_15100 [Pseudomonas endophytica]
MSKIITEGSHLQQESPADILLFGTPKDRLDFYRREIQYETTLLSNRTNAYLTAQSFLVIAFASSMANLNPRWGELFTLIVPTMMAVLGIFSSLHAWPGFRASWVIIDHWHFKQSHLLRSDPVMGNAYDDSPLFNEKESSQKGYRKSLMFSMRTPWLFVIFWMVLASFCICIQLSNAS